MSTNFPVFPGMPNFAQQNFQVPQAARPTRTHTPEPNPDYAGGVILQNPTVPVNVGGTTFNAPVGYDVVLNLQVAYDVASNEFPSGVRTKSRTATNGVGYNDNYVHIWGRIGQGVSKGGIRQMLHIGNVSVASPACLGITLRGDLRMLQAAGQLKRGHIVSFTGNLAVGTRQNGQPDVFLNGANFFDVKNGEIRSAVPQSVAPQANAVPLQATPAYVQAPAPADPNIPPAQADPSIAPF